MDGAAAVQMGCCCLLLWVEIKPQKRQPLAHAAVKVEKYMACMAESSSLAVSKSVLRYLLTK